MRICLDAPCLTAGLLVARPKAIGRLRYFFHLGTYALFVKLLYPFFSIESRICLQHTQHHIRHWGSIQQGAKQ